MQFPVGRKERALQGGGASLLICGFQPCSKPRGKAAGTAVSGVWAAQCPQGQHLPPGAGPSTGPPSSGSRAGRWGFPGPQTTRSP